jgi:methylated-DNA-[protein]-cysteine S-methyltransferase
LSVSPDLDARFRAAALREGLVDVRFDIIDSPVGDLLVASTMRGLCRISFTVEGQDEALARLFGARVLRMPLDEVRRELDEYFEGRRREFDLPLDWALVGPFGRRVLRVTSEIPYGGVQSYAEVASDAGSPRGSRAAGNALGSNPIPIVIPCHRVLRSGGALGGYGGGIERKRWLLELEGALTPSR